jgi:hypothetical protein
VSTQQVLRRAIDRLRAPLPGGWTLAQRDESPTGVSRPDAVLTIIDPTGLSADLVVEAQQTVERRDLGRISQQLQAYRSQSGATADALLVARYLPPLVRGDLEQLGINYADAVGNLRVSLDRPAVFLSDRVTDKDPWRRPGRPRGSLKGEPAARIVRTLLDSAGQFSISDLIKRSGASTGATYRVRDYLLEQGLLEQAGATYRAPDWPKLLREWADDYSSLDANITRRFLEPRGLQAVRARAADEPGFRYAMTGSIAAAEWAPYAPARAAFVYVEDLERAAEWLRIRPTEDAPNVILVEPKTRDSAVFLNSRLAHDGIMLASPSQVAADLLNGPGRSPSEAEELITWMRHNEGAWRR